MIVARGQQAGYFPRMTCSASTSPFRSTSVGLVLLIGVGSALALASCSGDDPAAAAPDPDASTGGQGAGGGGGEPDASSLPDSGMSGASGTSGSPDGAVTDGGMDGSPGNSDPDSGTGGDGDPEVDSGPPCVIPDGAEDITAPSAPVGDASVPVCWGMSWSAGDVFASASTSADDTLGSISGNDLNIAWLAVSADAGNDRVIHYANRHYPTDPFPSAMLLDPGTEADLDAGIALSADGLRLIVVQPDRKGFTEYSRDDAEEPFTTPPSDTQFDKLNTQISHYLPPGALCGDPVLSADDLTFYFSVYGFDDSSGDYGGYASNRSIYSLTRIPYVEWLAPGVEVQALQGDPIEAHCSSRRRPTGISADQLTLFYWDELSNSARAAFRPSIDEPFTGAVELGDRAFAQPSPDCTTLYYSGSGDVFTAD